MTEPSVYRPNTDDVITFAIEAPPHAILRDEIGAQDFLGFVQLVQKHWVLNGETETPRSPGLHHNVSNTCTVKASEWDATADFIWRHREHVTGVALLGHDGDKRYAQAPRESVSTDEDVAKVRTTVNGVATFDDLTVSVVGSFTLQASTPAVPIGFWTRSSPLQIYGAPHHLSVPGVVAQQGKLKPFSPVNLTAIM